jgi:hypothetical protein
MTKYFKLKESVRQKVLQRDNFSCRKCGLNVFGGSGTEIHHIKRSSFGGTNDIDNLISLCITCHGFCPFDEERFFEWLNSDKISLDRDFNDELNQIFINNRNEYYKYAIYRIVKLKNDIRNCYEKKRQDGLPPSISPYGYKNNKKTKRWTINKKESLIVKQVCEDYLNKVPLNNTIQNLKINKPLYYRILKNARNEIYSGFIYYINKYRDSNKVIIRKEEVKYKGIHEHLISEELYTKLNNARK